MKTLFAGRWPTADGSNNSRPTTNDYKNKRARLPAPYCCISSSSILGCGLLGERRFGLRREAGKPSRIVYRQVRQDLAVQFHSALLQPVHELAVAQPIKASRRADAHDPDAAELALLFLAAAVGELQPALHRFLRCLVQFRFCQEVSAGAL